MGKARQLALGLTFDVGGGVASMRPKLSRCEVCKVLSAELFPIFTIHGKKLVCDSPGCDYGY